VGGVRACVHDVGVILFLGGGRGRGRGDGTRVTGSGSIPRRGDRPGRAVSVTSRVDFIAIGASGRRGDTAVENGS